MSIRRECRESTKRRAGKGRSLGVCEERSEAPCWYLTEWRAVSREVARVEEYERGREREAGGKAIPLDSFGEWASMVATEIVCCKLPRITMADGWDKGSSRDDVPGGLRRLVESSVVSKGTALW